MLMIGDCSTVRLPPLRSGANKAHLAAQNIPELGQFVKALCSELLCRSEVFNSLFHFRSECFWKHKTPWGARLSIRANIWMPSMPIDDLLSPKVTPLLTGHNLKTVGKLLGGKFSRIRAWTQPDDRVVLTFIDQALKRKIKIGWCGQVDGQEYAVLYAEVRIPIYICGFKKTTMAVGYAGTSVRVTIGIDDTFFCLPLVGIRHRL